MTPADKKGLGSSEPPHDARSDNIWMRLRMDTTDHGTRALAGGPPSRAPRSRHAIAVVATMVAAVLLGACNAPHHGQHDATARHSFADVEHWTKVFDDPKRDEWQKPAQLVEALEIAPGMCVADLGAGTGYFSRYLSQAVGEHGTVLAVDPEPNLVVHLRARAETERTANVIPILASLDNRACRRAAWMSC